MKILFFTFTEYQVYSKGKTFSPLNPNDDLLFVELVFLNYISVLWSFNQLCITTCTSSSYFYITFSSLNQIPIYLVLLQKEETRKVVKFFG